MQMCIIVFNPRDTDYLFLTQSTRQHLTKTLNCLEKKKHDIIILAAWRLVSSKIIPTLCILYFSYNLSFCELKAPDKLTKERY